LDLHDKVGWDIYLSEVEIWSGEERPSFHPAKELHKHQHQQETKRNENGAACFLRLPSVPVN